VTGVTYLGSRLEVTLRLADGSAATANLVNSGTMAWQAGDEAEAWFRPEDAWPVPAEEAA
jgi:hypothetical protein